MEAIWQKRKCCRGIVRSIIQKYTGALSAHWMNTLRAAVIAATGRNPDLAGYLYPFPLFDAYMKDVDGARLLRYTGQTVRMRIATDSRHRSTCCRPHAW